MFVKQERTAWRDEGISRRHRTWGWDCPCIDIDFLLIEYTHNEPVALIEYKNERATKVDFSASGYKTLIRLADMAGLPAFNVRYADDYSWFEIVALNSRGVAWVESYQTMTEAEYVAFLYKLRQAPKRAAA